MRDLICKILTKMENRLTLEQIKKHAFLAEYFGETPVGREGWKVARPPELTFVNGVDPRLYEMSLHQEIPELAEEDIQPETSAPPTHKDEDVRTTSSCCVIL